MNESEQMAAIQLVLNGETEVFSALIVAFQASVLRTAYGITGNHAAAQDVAQDAFIAAFRYLADYDADRSTFACWLYGIVRHRAQTYLRRRGADRSTPEHPAAEHDPVCSGDDPAEALGRAELAARLDAALAALPESWRRAFTLTEIEGLSYADAAMMEGVPVGTIRSRVHRGRQALRQTLRRAPSLPRPSYEPEHSRFA